MDFYVVNNIMIFIFEVILQLRCSQMENKQTKCPGDICYWNMLLLCVCVYLCALFCDKWGHKFV